MTEPLIGQFCWNELAVTNVNKAKDFYGKTFGWQFKDVEMGDFTYTIISQQNNDIAGMWHIPASEQSKIPQHWMSYILVDDVDLALEEAKKHGAKIMRETTQAGNMGRLGIIVDPGGAHVGLWEPTKN